MVKNGTSKEVTFKGRFEEETYSDNVGKSSPYSWTSEAPGREGVGRGGKGWKGVERGGEGRGGCFSQAEVAHVRDAEPIREV